MFHRQAIFLLEKSMVCMQKNVKFKITITSLFKGRISLRGSFSVTYIYASMNVHVYLPYMTHICLNGPY